MKISDITANAASLENLLEKNRVQKNQTQGMQPSKKSLNDSFSQSKNFGLDNSMINEVYQNYQKNSAGLRGLLDMQKSIFEFEKKPETSRNFGDLSRELSNIVSGTKHNGENIISYLSTSVKDEKSFYMFKSRLSMEIDSTQVSMASERKNLASYLVKSENREVVSAFSPETAAKNIVSGLSKADTDNLFKRISNIQNLVSINR